jgi:hypothetical protein
LSSSRRLALLPRQTETWVRRANIPVARGTLAAMGIPGAIGNRHSLNHYWSRGPEAGARYARVPSFQRCSCSQHDHSLALLGLQPDSRLTAAGERCALQQPATLYSGCERPGSQAFAGRCATRQPDLPDEPAASSELQLGDPRPSAEEYLCCAACSRLGWLHGSELHLPSALPRLCPTPNVELSFPRGQCSVQRPMRTSELP